MKYFRFSLSLVSMTSAHLPCGIYWLYLEIKRSCLKWYYTACWVQSRLLFSVDLDHFLLLALIHSKKIWMAARINAYFITKSPYCENYRTVVVETAPIPNLRHMFRPTSLALWHTNDCERLRTIANDCERLRTFVNDNEQRKFANVQERSWTFEN